MAVTPLTTLSDYIKALGRAYVYVGSTATAGGMAILGATEGEVQVDESFKYNDLKAPEWTGDALHESDVDGAALKVTVPLIMGDPNLYIKINPLGVKGGGRSKPTPVTTTTVLLLPFSEIDASLAFAAGAWTPATPPVHAVWMWRARVMPGKYGFKHADGGKVIREVTFEAMFDDTKPEDHKLYTMGDPDDAGITFEL